MTLLGSQSCMIDARLISSVISFAEMNVVICIWYNTIAYEVVTLHARTVWYPRASKAFCALFQVVGKRENCLTFHLTLYGATVPSGMTLRGPLFLRLFDKNASHSIYTYTSC